MGLRPTACIEVCEGSSALGRSLSISEPGERMAKGDQFGAAKTTTRAERGSGLLLWFAAVVAICLPVSVRAQTNPYAIAVSGTAPRPPADTASEEADEPILTIKKRVDEVNVLFIATNRHGKFVRNLNENDFSILDDHKPVELILNFRRETDLPIELGLLIDTSGSVRGRFDFEQDAAVSFLQNTIRPNFDKAFVVAFNGHSQMMQGFTDNGALLSAAVHRMHDGGGTALYDAIYRACRDQLMKDHEDRPSRRAIVVVSDGEDNQSEFSEAQAIEMAQRAEVIIYAISTDDSGLVLRGDKVLQGIAEATGGRAFFPYKMKEMKNFFAAVGVG